MYNKYSAQFLFFLWSIVISFAILVATAFLAGFYAGYQEIKTMHTEPSLNVMFFDDLKGAVKYANTNEVSRDEKWKSDVSIQKEGQEKFVVINGKIYNGTIKKIKSNSPGWRVKVNGKNIEIYEPGKVDKSKSWISNILSKGWNRPAKLFY